MPRPVYLIVFPSPLFAAHWGLWIPSMGELDVGKYLHATGDAANGFQVAFKRNYDLSTSGRSYQLLELAQVLDDYIVDVKGDGSESEDQTAHDYLEEVALSIPAPDRSLVPATTPGPRKQVAIQNCQTWLRRVVNALVQNKVMDQSALQIIDSAPRN